MHSDIYAPLNNFPPTVHREKALNMGQIFFPNNDDTSSIRLGQT